MWLSLCGDCSAMFCLQTKLATTFVMAVLLSSLAYSEFPELASLSDNTSNDFTTQSCLAGSGEVAIVTAIPVPAKAPGSCIPNAKFSDVQLRLRPRVFSISDNLFLLYSILRT